MPVWECGQIRRYAVQTIVVAASRPVDMTDIAMMVALGVIAAALAWKLVAGLKRRHQPHG
jgi:Na+/pantothenate symporter